jgi:hypothetical protein
LDEDDLLALVLISIQNLPILKFGHIQCCNKFLCDVPEKNLKLQKIKITKKYLVEKP